MVDESATAGHNSARRGDAITSSVNAQLVVLAAVALYAATDAMVKYLASRYSVMEIAFFRHLFSLIPVAVLVHREGGVAALRTDKIWLHILRALLGAGSMLLYFLSFSLMPLADVIAIGFTAPLMLVVLSRIVFAERIGRGRFWALLCGFLGVLFIVRPGGDILNPIALLPVGAAALLASYMLMIRILSKTESASSMMLYVPVVGMIVSAAFLPWVGESPSAPDLGLLAIMGVLGGAALFLRNEAYSRAPAAALAPFEYTGVLWAAVFGYLVFGDGVTMNLVLGTGILIVTNLYMIWTQAAGRRAPP
jgi:drug/metabolite transporter (DMT)-like permease